MFSQHFHNRMREMGCQVPIILLTSIGSRILDPERRGSNFAAVLIKPVKKNKLGRAMAEILMRARVTPVASSKAKPPSSSRDLCTYPALDAEIGCGTGAAKGGSSPLHLPPLFRSPQAKTPKTSKLAPALAAAVAKLPPLKMLLVEDNPINQKGRPFLWRKIMAR